MFVSKKKYKEVKEQLDDTLEDLYFYMASAKRFSEWCDRLKSRIDVLERQNKQSKSEFTESEIKTLISLCHPDKHNGRDSAKKITQKLLTMRGKK